MRDLRDELRQRLQAIGLERAELQERLSWLEQLEQHVNGLLEYEKMRVATESRQPALFSEEQPTDEQRSALSLFIRDALADREPHSLEDLKKIAQDRGVLFGDKNPGRVLHFALVGMSQSGVVESLGNGVWKMKPDDPNTGGYVPGEGPKRALGQIAGR